jgi:hypothetical protein
MKIEVYGYIKNKKLTISNRRRLEADLQTFPDSDVVVIIKRRGKRSSPQNRYYWGVVIDSIRREFKRRGTITEPETIHEALKAKFNPEKLANKDGEPILEIGGSTTAMNKAEFAEYLERVIMWCNESLEIDIPEAGSQTQLFAA